jgi:hypothetical protein
VSVRYYTGESQIKHQLTQGGRYLSIEDSHTHAARKEKRIPDSPQFQQAVFIVIDALSVVSPARSLISSRTAK